jgi:hypothetical protein
VISGAVATELPGSVTEPDVSANIRKFYEAVAIPAESFAQVVAFAISQPDDVDVNEILFRPTQQEAKREDQGVSCGLFAPAQFVRTSIIDKDVTRGGRSDAHVLDLASWRRRHDEEHIQVSPTPYRRMHIGEEVVIEAHGGRFGVSWCRSIAPYPQGAPSDSAGRGCRFPSV